MQANSPESIAANIANRKAAASQPKPQPTKQQLRDRCMIAALNSDDYETINAIVDEECRELRNS